MNFINGLFYTGSFLFGHREVFQMSNEYDIFESSDEPHSFEIIGRSGHIIYRPDHPGASVSIEQGGVIATKDINGNFQEIYVLQPGERARLIE